MRPARLGLLRSTRLLGSTLGPQHRASGARIHVCLRVDIDGTVIVPLILLPIPLPAAILNFRIVFPVEAIRRITEGIRIGRGPADGKPHDRDGGRQGQNRFLHNTPRFSVVCRETVPNGAILIKNFQTGRPLETVISTFSKSVYRAALFLIRLRSLEQAGDFCRDVLAFALATRFGAHLEIVGLFELRRVGRPNRLYA